MTQPAPGSTELNFASEIQNVPTSPTVMRIGVVTEIVDSDNIVVKISGSNVLVRASFLFPAYRPLLGDRVSVLKQDAQWFVLGTISGPINSAIANPSFEEGNVGDIPPGWTTQVLASAGGVPTFTTVLADGIGVSGLHDADLGTDSTVAGISDIYVFSSSVPASPGQRWTGAYFITFANIDQQAGTGLSGGRFAVIYLTVEFLDSSNAVISAQDISVFGTNANISSPVYVTPTVGTPYAVAPVDTVAVRMRLEGIFDMTANSFTSFFLDYMILRTPD